MVRSLVLVVAALVVALMAWRWMPSGDPAPATMVGDSHAAEQVSPPPPEAPIVAVPADASAVDRARVEIEAAAVAGPSIPDDAVAIEVLVLDGKTKAPVAGADAVWGGALQHEFVAKLPPGEGGGLYRDQEAMFAKFGWHGRSDHDGKLRLRVQGWTNVFAREGTRYGTVSIQADKPAPPEGYRLLLDEDLTVRVHVLDAAGRDAVDVPVSLDCCDADGEQQASYGDGIATDGAGMAAFQHAQSRQVWNWGKHRGEPVAQWAACVKVPGLEVGRVLVDAQSPPVEPVEIRLPPTGRLKVKVTFEGRPIPGLDRLRFHAGPRDTADALNGSWYTYVDQDGWARFGHVPLGKTLYVLPGGAASWDIEVAGPTEPEQEVTAALEIADSVVTLVGRLLEADGAPVAGQTITADFHARIMSGTTQVQTDKDGRFVWAVYRPRPEEKTELALDRLAFERRLTGTPPQRVNVPPRALVVGRNDLGDLRFTVDSLVVGGHFVFDTPGSTRTWFQIERAGDSRGRNGSTVRWEMVQGLQVDVQEDGAFQVRGTVEPGRYRLRLEANNHLPVDPVEFQVGTADLRIDVHRGVPLEVDCQLPAGVETRNLWLRVQPAGSAASPKPADDEEWHPLRQDPLRGQTWGEAGQTVKYRWPALPAGTCSLLVLAPGLAEPLVRIDDIALPLPQGGDPRLHPLDLRDAIGTLRVKLTMQGERQRDAFLFFQPQFDDRTWHAIRMTAGESVLPVPKRPVDLLFASDGLRPVTVRGEHDLVEVTLEPWPTVAVHFLGLDALPADFVVRAYGRDTASGVRGARYEFDGGSGPRDGMMQPNASAVVGKDGVASLPIGDGVRNLSIYLSLGERGPGKWLKQFTPNQIVAGAPVTVQLDADEIRTVITALREQAAKK